MGALSKLLIGAACEVLIACGHDVVAPHWPVELQLRLVNASNATVFVMAAGDESCYPGVAHLAPGDSAWTWVYAFADSVPVEVHPLGNPDVTIGMAWIYPQAGLTWHGAVQEGRVTVAPCAACSN